MDADVSLEVVTYSLFAGTRRIAAGELQTIAAAAREAALRGEAIVAIADATGRVVDIDLRDPPPNAGAVAAPPKKPGRGRPKLGVVPREVTLLPRHWDWLQAQPGGASAALRRLVDQARRDTVQVSRRRNAREAAHRAMTVLAGDLTGYEEALRALYAGDREGFRALISTWPSDVRTFVDQLASAGWTKDDAPLD